MSLGMSYAEGPSTDWEKKQKARNEAMKSRLEKLPQNPVVKKTTSKLNKQINATNNSDQWAPVDSLVSTAYGQFCDGDMTFTEAAKGLGEAISALTNAKK